MEQAAADSKLIYLDHNATTPVAPEVAQVIMTYLQQEGFGNPSSVHRLGIFAKSAIDTARAQVARIINAKQANEIIFTSGGSESINYAIKGTALLQRRADGALARDLILASSVEHPAVLESCRYLQRQFGFRLVLINVDSRGVVDLAHLSQLLERDSACLVTVMHANNETGVLQPIAEIAKVIKEKSPACVFHSDASQSVGKVPIDVQLMQVDLLTVAGHKLYAPKGIGALYVRNGIVLDKLIHGAGHESNRRAGTENTPYIAGLGKACELASTNLAHNMQHFYRMRDRLIVGFQAKLGAACRVNGDGAERLPNTASIAFKGLQAVDLISKLKESVAMSAGSACHSGTVHMSAVLAAMGVTADFAFGTIRFSTGLSTTEADIDRAIELVVSQLQSCPQPAAH